MKHILLIVTAIFLIVPFATFAHEHQIFKIGNKYYEFTVGSLNEPVVVDDKSGVDITVKEIPAPVHGGGHADGDHAVGVPVLGLEETLKVELSAGGKTKILDLTTQYGKPGSYKAVFFPTVPTTLIYRVFGKLNGVDINLTFQCNPAGHVAAPEDNTEVPIGEGVTRIAKRGQYGCPITKADLGFPEQSWSLTDIHNDGHAHMTGMMKDAATTKSRATTGLILGLAGVVLGGLALWKTKKGGSAG